MPDRFQNFTDDELAALAQAMRLTATPMLGTLPNEVHAERLSRLDKTAN